MSCCGWRGRWTSIITLVKERTENKFLNDPEIVSTVICQNQVGDTEERESEIFGIATA